MLTQFVVKWLSIGFSQVLWALDLPVDELWEALDLLGKLGQELLVVIFCRVKCDIDDSCF